jgi:chromosome segregation ATPase
MEVIVLRSRIEAAEQTQRDTDAMASQLEELSHVIDERDSVRRDYASLREQFETLKLDRSQLDSTEELDRLRDENQQLRDQLASAGTAAGSPPASDDAAGDLAALKEQLKQAKEETSLAHRGLALSQKALQETREALREATEGTSTSKGNLEEAKKERAGLQRQNQLLQGQIDQLTRELSAAKAKLAAKGA